MVHTEQLSSCFVYIEHNLCQKSFSDIGKCPGSSAFQTYHWTEVQHWAAWEVQTKAPWLQTHRQRGVGLIIWICGRQKQTKIEKWLTSFCDPWRPVLTTFLLFFFLLHFMERDLTQLSYFSSHLFITHIIKNGIRDACSSTNIIDCQLVTWAAVETLESKYVWEVTMSSSQQKLNWIKLSSF